MFDFLSNKFSHIFKSITGTSHLSEKNITQTLEKVRESLLEADIPYDVVEQFIQEIKQDVTGKKILHSMKPAEQLIKIIHEKICEFLGSKKTFIGIPEDASIILVMGLQGSGKTTTISKICRYLQKKNKKASIMTASVDFSRPAAIEQLEILSNRIGVTHYNTTANTVLEAVQEIIKESKNNSYDYLLLDTAGRMHIDNQLLQELRDITSCISKSFKLLVVDAMTGQESLTIAQAFDQGVGFDSAIMTKMDSQARAGASFAFNYVLKKNIILIGTGEKPDDYELFYPERMASRILDMGDLNTLLEKAEEKIKKSEQKNLHSAYKRGKLTLEDFAQQLGMIQRLGSLNTIMKYMPGVSAQNISDDMINQGQVQMNRFKAIINSMTPKERKNHRILDNSRKNRIARGAGVPVKDIDLLLQRFEQMQQYVKLFKRMGRFPGF